MKVYDCFTFFNEIDLLKIRLSFLYEVVDKFIIVEASKTQTGLSKDFNFLLHREEFSKYLDKIEYIQVEDMPSLKNETGSLDWTLENFQRNCIIRGGVLKCNPDDIIMISDLDEIPDPKILQNIKNYKLHRINFCHNRFRDCAKQFFRLLSLKKYSYFKYLSDALEYTPVVCKQTMYYYYMNFKSNRVWFGTIIVKFKNFQLPQTLRNMRNSLPYIENGGWHFSFLGGREKIKIKLDSIIEGSIFKDWSKSYGDTDAFIDYLISTGRDSCGEKTLEKVPFSQLEDCIARLSLEYPEFFLQ